MNNIVNNFKYGEITPLLKGRVDSEALSQGCSYLENFTILDTGGASRRCPLHLITETTGIKRIVEFTISSSLSFEIGFGNNTYSIYQVDNLVTETKKRRRTLVQVVTNQAYLSGYDNLTDSDIKNLRYAQYYKDIYFVVASHPIMRFHFYSGSGNIVMQIPVIRINQGGRYEKGYYYTDANGTKVTLYTKYIVNTLHYYTDETCLNEYTWNDDAYKPVQDTLIETNGYYDYSNDTLNTGLGHYASEIKIIADKMFLSATDEEPDTMWISRPYGASQRLEGDDSLLDFIQYQVVETTTTVMKDVADFPTTTKKDSNGSTIYQRDSATGELIYKYYDESGNEQLLYINYVDNVRHFYTDSECTIEWTGDKHNIPYIEYDLSDSDNLVETKTVIDYIATSSTAMKIQLASGRNDKILWICAGENIYIGTESSEWILPLDINATNYSARRYSSFGSKPVEAMHMGTGIFFIQKDNHLKELYMNDGYTVNADLTYTAGDYISDSDSMLSKVSPTPTIFFLDDDGSMRVLVLDTNAGITAWSRWTFKNKKILSIAIGESEENRILFALVSETYNGTTKTYLAYFDEYEDTDFSDDTIFTNSGNGTYLSKLVTNRFDVNSQNDGITVGYKKHISRITMRPYASGHCYTGYKDTDMSMTPPSADPDNDVGLGDDDFVISSYGGSERELMVAVKSYKNEPLTILAIAFEWFLEK